MGDLSYLIASSLGLLRAVLAVGEALQVNKKNLVESA
jgi:hypothetical protein